MFAARILALALALGSPASLAWGATIWGSSSLQGANPSGVFTINSTTGFATLVGNSGLPNGVSAIRFDSNGVLYGIHGASIRGAQLVTINTSTGVATPVGPLVGAGFNQGFALSGSDALAFAPDGTLYAGGWNGGTFDGGSLLTLDKTTGAVLTAVPTTGGIHLSGLAFAPDGGLWASHGNNFSGVLHTIDPLTGSILMTLNLDDPSAAISDLIFGPGGVLFAALPQEGQLASIDTTTGVITRLGFFGDPNENERISGLAIEPQQAAPVPEPASIAVWVVAAGLLLGARRWRSKRDDQRGYCS